MALNTTRVSCGNMALHVYIGNTSSLDDQLVFDYCSRFGSLVPQSCVKEKFCDFHTVEFSDRQQLDHFLQVPRHEINRIPVDVKLYKHLLNAGDIFSVDRKLFVGPIVEPTDVLTIVQFYQMMDSQLHYGLSKHGEQTYLLIEFTSRRFITAIFEKQAIPGTPDQRTFTIHKPVNPRKFARTMVRSKNMHQQIFISGLTEAISETLLMYVE